MVRTTRGARPLRITLCHHASHRHSGSCRTESRNTQVNRCMAVPGCWCLRPVRGAHKMTRRHTLGVFSLRQEGHASTRATSGERRRIRADCTPHATVCSYKHVDAGGGPPGVALARGSGLKPERARSSREHANKKSTTLPPLVAARKKGSMGWGWWGRRRSERCAQTPAVPSHPRGVTHPPREERSLRGGRGDQKGSRLTAEHTKGRKGGAHARRGACGRRWLCGDLPPAQDDCAMALCVGASRGAD